jgi:hypothetical protein
MRKGWKTRIEERRYFEEKKLEREAKIEFTKMMRLKLQHEIDQMRRETAIGGLFETH